jgi:hypothetical protein
MRRYAGWLTAAIIGVLVAGCTSNKTSTPPSETPTSQTATPVALSLTVDQPITIGVLVGSTHGDGSEYRDTAEGARVATYRFAMEEHDVSLKVALEDGTSESVTAGLAKLTDSGVSGIVVATAGAHVRQALTASDIEPPIIAVYDTLNTAPQGVWWTGPSRSAITNAMSVALDDTHSTKPYLVAASQAITPDLSLALSSELTSNSSGDIATDVVTKLESGQADSVIVAAPASSQAEFVTAFQEKLGGRQVPMLLTPQALTPSFATNLGDSGLLSNSLIAVGTNAVDASALTTGADADRASAFFTALRLAANDPNCRNIYSDASFTKAAQTADIASHDAVVALVRAVEAAKSTTPADVKQSLASLNLGPSAGISGPPLNFTQPDALDGHSVVPMRPARTNLGLRPATTTATITWFPTT